MRLAFARVPRRVWHSAGNSNGQGLRGLAAIREVTGCTHMGSPVGTGSSKSPNASLCSQATGKWCPVSTEHMEGGDSSRFHSSDFLLFRKSQQKSYYDFGGILSVI